MFGIQSSLSLYVYLSLIKECLKNGLNSYFENSGTQRLFIKGKSLSELTLNKLDNPIDWF